jgi:hypothetical protein
MNLVASPLSVCNEEDRNLIFDSTFEGGNLDAVVKVNDSEYDLFMRVDSNTRGHLSWYNFKLTSEVKRTIRLNIVNFTRIRTLYTFGMQPFIRVGEGEWKQGG